MLFSVTVLHAQLKKLEITTRIPDLKDVRNIRRQCSNDFNELVKDALDMMRQPVGGRVRPTPASRNTPVTKVYSKYII